MRERRIPAVILATPVVECGGPVRIYQTQPFYAVYKGEMKIWSGEEIARESLKSVQRGFPVKTFELPLTPLMIGRQKHFIIREEYLIRDGETPAPGIAIFHSQRTAKRELHGLAEMYSKELADNLTEKEGIPYFWADITNAEAAKDAIERLKLWISRKK